MFTLLKPAGCTCRYPEVIARNMCGHDFSCPVYVAWRAEWDRQIEEQRTKAAESVKSACGVEYA